jgi:hypothetical protein
MKVHHHLRPNRALIQKTREHPSLPTIITILRQIREGFHVGDR